MAHGKSKKHKASPAAALLFTALFITIALFTAGLFFKVRNIEVTGAYTASPGAVRSASGIDIGQNIFLIEKSSAVNAITERFPNAESVSIRRSLPGTVVIELVETGPACKIKSQGYYWYIDKTGRILSCVAALKSSDYAEVTGVALINPVVGRQAEFFVDEGDKRHALLPLLEALDTAGLLGEVTLIDVDLVYDVRIVINNRLEVRLGVPDDYQYKCSYIPHAIENMSTDGPWTLDVSQAMEKNVLLAPKK
jgi:cell division protein FtsQ